MPESSFNHPLFGVIEFRTATKARWIRGDSISFVSGFDESEITPLVIPQLANIEGTPGGRLLFHRKGHEQLLSVFREIEDKQLLHHIKTCAGTWNKRLRKPIDGGTSRLPSNHAFGIAIDLNSDDGSNGGSVTPVAPIFQSHGFTWGKSFNDPMHFEINTFTSSADSFKALKANLQFIACRGVVFNRGRAPLSFLNELVSWGRSADQDIFQKNNVFDVYSSVINQLGPWRNDLHRKAVMLEVLRVLGGFESSWNWHAGVDERTNPATRTICTEEAGIFQCSANSMNYSDNLKALAISAGGDGTCESFIEITKEKHNFAIEYCARLLRITTKHHGPIRYRKFHDWLARDAVDEFLIALS